MGRTVGGALGGASQLLRAQIEGVKMIFNIAVIFKVVAGAITASDVCSGGAWLPISKVRRIRET